jgi:hypothetical protein
MNHRRSNLARIIPIIYRAMHHALDGIDANPDAYAAADEAAAPAGLCGASLCARTQRCRRTPCLMRRRRQPRRGARR